MYITYISKVWSVQEGRTSDWGCVTSMSAGLRLGHAPGSPEGCIKTQVAGNSSPEFLNQRIWGWVQAYTFRWYWHSRSENHILRTTVLNMCHTCVWHLGALITIHINTCQIQVSTCNIQGTSGSPEQALWHYTSSCNIWMMCVEGKWTSICLWKHVNKCVWNLRVCEISAWGWAPSQKIQHLEGTHCLLDYTDIYKNNCHTLWERQQWVSKEQRYTRNCLH